MAWKKQNILDGQSVNYVNKYFEKDAREHGFYSENLIDYLASGGSLQERDDVPDWAKNIYTTAPEISPEAKVIVNKIVGCRQEASASNQVPPNP